MRALALTLPLALRGLRRPRVASFLVPGATKAWSSDTDQAFAPWSSASGGDSRVNAPWTPKEDWALWTAREEDMGVVASRLGRKHGGVASRLRKLEDPSSSASKRLWGEEEEEEEAEDGGGAEEAADGEEADFLRLADDDLLRQCRVDFRRDSGPGGQKRNKVESACRITHEPTGVVANAADERSQHANKAIALKRLRRAIAHEVRRTTPDVEVAAADGIDGDLAGILPWTRAERVGAKNPARPRVEQLLLDVVDAAEGALAVAAAHLGGTTGQLSKVLVKDDALFTATNRIRQRHKLAPLKRKR